MRRPYPISCLLLALAVGACDSEVTAVNADGMNRVSLFLADGPGHVENVWLQFDQIYLISIDGAQDANLVELLDEPTGLIEVTSLVDSVKALALDVAVDTGSYNELRLILGSAVLETEDGNVYTFGDPDLPDSVDVTGDLHCPSCATSGIKIRFDVELHEGSGDIVLDFDVGQSFGHVAGRSGRWIMHPVIRALHDRHDDDHDDDDHDHDDDDNERGRGYGRGRKHGGDQDRFASISGRIALADGVAIPACPAERSRSVDDFMPTATAAALVDMTGDPLVATGHVDDDDEEFEFKIWRLKADTWTLGFEEETTVSDAGHVLAWEATVEPAEVELSAGERATGIAYTITAATCEAP